MAEFLPAVIGPMFIRPQIVCADGFTISVQASAFHYCSPRRNEGPYTEVEVGFPSEYEPLLAPYSDGSGVFPYTPIDVVREVILKHGGPVGLTGSETRINISGSLED
jgi:hypothetical protein